MPLDTRIPLMGSDLGEAAQQGMTLGAMAQQSQMRNMQMGAMQQQQQQQALALARQNQARQAYQSHLGQDGKLDEDGLLADLYKIDPSMATDFSNFRTNRDKAAAEAMKNKADAEKFHADTANLQYTNMVNGFDTINGVLGKVTDDNRLGLARQYIDKSFGAGRSDEIGIPKQYDPAAIQTLIDMHTSQKQQIEQKWKEQDLTNKQNDQRLLSQKQSNEAITEKERADAAMISAKAAMANTGTNRSLLVDQPQQNTLAQMLLDGELDSSKLSFKNRSAIIAQAKQIDPSFDEATNSADIQSWKKNKQALQSMQIVQDNIGILKAVSDKLKRTGIPAGNNVLQWVRKNMGDTTAAQYEAAVQMIQDDLGSAVGVGAGASQFTDKKLEFAKGVISPDLTAGQLESKLQIVDEALNAKKFELYKTSGQIGTRNAQKDDKLPQSFKDALKNGKSYADAVKGAGNKGTSNLSDDEALDKLFPKK